MNRIRLALLVVLLAVAGTVAVVATRGEEERERGEARAACVEEHEGEAEERESGGKRAEDECPEEVGKELQEPFDAYLARQLSGSDVSPAKAYPRALAQAAALPRNTSTSWSFLGPSNIGGRVLDIALDSASPDTIYAATASGGVMKSTDAGVTFTSSWPDDLPQAIGALTSGSDGTLYAGTGEAGPGGGALTYGGTGVYRSTDHGATWQRIGLEKSVRIGRILVDPQNPKRIFVAALGDLFKPTTDRGLYRSEDAGTTWTKVLATDNGTTGAADVAIDPKNPQRMLATTWDAQRTPTQRRYTGSGSGLYRSTDGGKTWTRIAVPLLSNPEVGRIGVAIDPQAPDKVYVIASGVIGNHVGFFTSTDFGTTLVPTVAASQAGLDGAFTYGWWFGRVWVDPKDSNRIFTAGVGLSRSDDGGRTFDAVNGDVHADQHAMVWDPRKPDRVWLGNDGGVYRSDDKAGTFIPAKVQPFSQPDTMDVSEQDATRIVAGLQDNGEIRSWPKTWNAFGPGGDGQAVVIDPTDKDTIYACGQNLACEVSHDGGDSGSAFGDAKGVTTSVITSSRNPFFAPIALDPKNPKVVYAGGEILNRSTDQAASWEPISPDLSNGPGTQETNPLYANYGTISALAAGPDSDGATGTIYVGTDDGNVQYTHTGGGAAGWTKADDATLPKAWVRRIVIDPRDDKVAYVAYSGFRSGDTAAYLVRTKDGGQTWKNLTGDLPHVPIEDVELVGDNLIVANDVGVFASLDDGAHWFGVGGGLPQVPVYEIKAHKGAQTLFAATFGRSIWKLPLAAALTPPATLPVPAVVKGKRSYLGLPLRRSCRASLARRLRFKIRAKGVAGVRFTRATIRVNSAKTIVVRGKALKRYVTVRIPRGRAIVRVSARATDGKLYTAKRTYRACPVKKQRG